MKKMCFKPDIIFICFWVFLTVFSANVFANHGILEGAPLMTRYLPQDYSSSSGHSTIASDKTGRIYVGNSEGVLRFDGTQWELTELPGRSEAREILAARDGKLYVASFDTFGVLNTDNSGQLQYQELVTASKFDLGKQSLGIVWAVVQTQQGVYFQAENFLFFVSYDRKTFKHWPLDENVRTVFSYRNQVYARIEGKGFCAFQEGEFLLEKGGEQFKHLPVGAVIDEGDWGLLVTSEGFFRSDARGIRQLGNIEVKALKDSKINSATRLSDNSIAVGTTNGEVLRFDTAFHLLQKIKAGNFAVLAMKADVDGGLWLATEGDILRIAMPSPWSKYDEAMGVAGNVYDFEWHRGLLWFVGSNGVSQIRHGEDGIHKAMRLPWLSQEAFTIKSTGNDLLIGHRDGLMVLDQGQNTPRHLKTPENETVFNLIEAQNNPDLMYAISDHYLFILSKRPGQWQILRQHSFDQIDPAEVIELKPGELWIGNSRGQPEQWIIDTNSLEVKSKKRFGAAQGFPAATVTQRLYRFDDHIHAVTGDKDYRFNGTRFELMNTPPFSLMTRPYEISVLENETGAYAYSSREILYKAKNANQWKIVRSGLTNSAGYNNLKFNQDGVLRMSSWDGILQYVPSAEKTAAKPLTLKFAYVDAISVDGKTTLALPTDTRVKAAEVPAGHNMKLRFEMINLDSAVDYRYRLNQVSKEWSAWSDRDLFIRALPPGDYAFDLQAKTRAGQIADTVTYRFRVLPFWYERLWVRIAGILLVLASVFLISQALIRARTARYRSANIELETKISERTHELEIANQRLSELVTEDALTGVANRRALEQGLQREWFRCLDLKLCLSAMMIDVDHFKRYNDKHGHLEGDKVLREIAQSLQFEHDSQRELFARFGGEEFALLLPGISLEETLRRAELIRSKINKFPNDISVSIGVAGFVPSLHVEKNSLLRRADAALYRAKRLGRNRVEVDND
jgi:diguanylate cyclase (GGDEF)-like protein